VKERERRGDEKRIRRGREKRERECMINFFQKESDAPNCSFH
jgi:hypothetical protein